MKTLIVDNNLMPEYWGSEDLVAQLRPFATASEIKVRRGPHDDLPSTFRHFDRVVLSGSLTSADEQAPWIDHLDALIREGVDAGVPILGICYGHQSIVRALHSRQRVRKAKEPEYGWTAIEKVAEASLLRGLADRFHSYSSHQDEVFDLPSSFRVLARSERCGVQGYELMGKPVWGFQFHPEKTLEEGNRSIALRKAQKKVVIGPHQGKRVFDPKISESIFGNFMRLDKL